MLTGRDTNYFYSDWKWLCGFSCGAGKYFVFSAVKVVHICLSLMYYSQLVGIKFLFAASFS